MTILAKTLLTLVGSHLMTLMLLSVRHNPDVFMVRLNFIYFTFATKLFAGLNAGILCSGIVIAVPLRILRATF